MSTADYAVEIDGLAQLKAPLNDVSLVVFIYRNLVALLKT